MELYSDDWIFVDDDLPQVDKTAKNRQVIVNVLFRDGTDGIGYVKEDTMRWFAKRNKYFRLVGESNPVTAWQSIEVDVQK